MAADCRPRVTPLTHLSTKAAHLLPRPLVRSSAAAQFHLPKGVDAGDHFVVEDNPETQVLTLRKVKDGGDWFGIYGNAPIP
ncbi:MAG: hypothetical protein J0M24_01000 [Verrucomicrobia bacterium]|nr:hypothetical protein [Verrucomicrobiota bacterium]